MLEALGDPGHPRHEEIAEWMPPGFDPAYFDAREINLVLKDLESVTRAVTLRVGRGT